MRRVTAVLLVTFCLAAPATALAQRGQAGVDGAALYGRWCVSCHEQGAVARAPARDVIAALSADRIVEVLESGTMRVQGEVLSPDERRAVASYLTASRPASTPAVPARATHRRPPCVRPGKTGSPGA